MEGQPALSASSPILDGKFTHYIDGRMEAYSHHQERMPSLMGKLIPEQVFTEVNYHKVIYEPILKDIRPFDKEKIMDHHFLNSRGAIARFDRGAIEIRVIDVQECPRADMAICNIISALLKELVDEKFCSLDDQKSWHEHDLRSMFDEVIKHGSNSMINNGAYLKLFGQSGDEMTVSALWKAIYQNVKSSLDEDLRPAIELILSKGNLSERILKHTSENPSSETILKTYKELAACLQENRQLD